MAIAPGTRIGQFEVLAKLGADTPPVAAERAIRRPPLMWPAAAPKIAAVATAAVVGKIRAIATVSHRQ